MHKWAVIYFVGLKPLVLSQSTTKYSLSFHASKKSELISFLMGLNCCISASTPWLKSFETQQKPTNEGRESCNPSELVSRSTSTNELFIYWYPPPTIWLSSWSKMCCGGSIINAHIASLFLSLYVKAKGKKGVKFLRLHHSTDCVLCSTPHFQLQIKLNVRNTNSGFCVHGHVMGWVFPDIHQRSNHFSDGCPLVRPHRRDRLGKEASGHQRSSAIVDCCWRERATETDDLRGERTPKPPKFEHSRIWRFEGDRHHRIAPRGGIPPSTSSWTTVYLGGDSVGHKALEPQPKLNPRF